MNPKNVTPIGLNKTTKAPTNAIIGRQMNPLSGTRFYKSIGKLEFQNIIDCLPQVDPNFIYSYYQNMYKQKYWSAFVEESEYMVYYLFLNFIIFIFFLATKC
jgi:hypothetical protein